MCAGKHGSLGICVRRPVARDFERGVLFDQKWTFTCMMINKGTETGCAKHTQSRGVWGHAPPENF